VTLNDGNWHHVAIVRSGTTTTVYIDGVSGGSETSSGEYRDNANSLTIGDKWALSTERFSPGALSTMEIVKGRALWTASFTPPTLREDFLHYDSVLTLTADWESDHYDNQVQDQAKRRSITFSLYNSLYGTYRGGPVYPFVFGSQDFTVDCWVRRGTYSQGSDQSILTFYGDSTSLYALRIISAPTYVIKAQVHDGTTEYSLTNYYSQIPQMWSHLALVRSGTTIALYLDGVQIATQTVASNYTLRKVQGGVFRIWCTAPFPTNPLGLIGNMRVIIGKALWTAGFTPPRDVRLWRREATDQCKLWWHGRYDSSVLRYAASTQSTGKSYWNGYDGTQYNGEYYGEKGGIISAMEAPFNPGTKDFTIEFWTICTYNSDNYTRGIFAHDAGGTSAVSWRFYVSNGYLTATLYSESGNTYNMSDLNSISLYNAWHHIAMTRRGSDLRLFIDGRLSGSASLSANTVMKSTAMYPLIFNSIEGYPYAGAVRDFRFLIGTAKYVCNFLPSFEDPRVPQGQHRY
jgi:hypothetical protein